MPAAEHRLTIEVIDEVTSAPIDGVIVRLGAFRGTTDSHGWAEIPVARGRYDLVVWKSGYDAPDTAVEVTGDARHLVAMQPVPEEDPDARWRG